MNNSGLSTEGIIELAELVSCAKRTMARVLVIIVSVGYGVVKPRLGNVLNQVAGVGLVYFVFCAIESLSRVSKVQTMPNLITSCSPESNRSSEAEAIRCPPVGYH